MPSGLLRLARSNGCGSPVYWRPEVGMYCCMKCDKPIFHHPRGPEGSGWVWVDEVGRPDEWSEILRIMDI